MSSAQTSTFKKDKNNHSLYLCLDIHHYQPIYLNNIFYPTKLNLPLIYIYHYK